MPAVSVVIPCFNAADTLDETLASVVAQTFMNIEIICVDDGSSDGTLALLADWTRRDSRIRIIPVANGGPSWARNTGAAAAKGGWIAFLDADDIWLPDKLASVAEVFLADPKADAVFGQVAFFRKGDCGDATVSKVREGPAILSDVLGENPVCTLSNLTVRRDAFYAVNGFDETLHHSEDLEFLIRFVSSGYTLVGCNECHLRYRASEDGLSANLARMHEGWRKAIQAVSLSPSERNRAEAVHMRYLARRALRIGAPAVTALCFAARGLQRSPAAFLGDRYRGTATLAGCLAAPFLPVNLRRRAFA